MIVQPVAILRPEPRKQQRAGARVRFLILWRQLPKNRTRPLALSCLNAAATSSASMSGSGRWISKRSTKEVCSAWSDRLTDSMMCSIDVSSEVLNAKFRVPSPNH